MDEGSIWNATDLDGMTIKSEVENKDFKITTELKNIVLKTPAASLFEIPEGYTEAKSFMDVMTDRREKITAGSFLKILQVLRRSTRMKRFDSCLSQSL